MSQEHNTSKVLIEAYTLDDLKSQIDRLKIEVPPRAQSSANDEREQWQAQHLLLALFSAHQLPPPVRLHKRDAPDFLLEIKNMRIGVETTEAINRDYVRAQMHPAAQQEGAVVDPSLYKWGTEGRPTSQIREEAGRKQLSGYGWSGDNVEREFARSIVDVVHRKTLKLRSHYVRYESDCLLVYHNHPSPAIDIEKARIYAAKSLESYWGQSGFHTVYVHKHNWMLYFIKNASGILFEFPRSDAPFGMDIDVWERLESVEKLYLKSLEAETEIMQFLPTSAPEPEDDCYFPFEDDLQSLCYDWLADRGRAFLERGCDCLLLPPDRIRLRTACEVANCPDALDLFRGCVLELVIPAVADADADVHSTTFALLHGTMASRGSEFQASMIAVLRYLITFEDISHWTRDSRRCSMLLQLLDSQA